MKFLIYGAGTIGLSYGWLLSAKHDVSVLVKPDKLSAATTGYSFTVHDLREKPRRDLQFEYRPTVVTQISEKYDAILVTVNRRQLKSVLPALQNSGADIIFMLNHWDLRSEVAPYLRPQEYLVGFPSQVGGGREGDHVEVNVYGAETVLGEVDGEVTPRLTTYKEAFDQAGLTVEVKTNVLDWLKVHYLQQSITAGAVLKAGDFRSFAHSRQAVKAMVQALREGVAVCAAYGVDTKHTFPANLLSKPTFLVVQFLTSMFTDPDTVLMVEGHMKHGLDEWIAGYYEVLNSGEEKGIAMPAWKAYKPYVDDYMDKSSH
ncbi:MAG: hypothetical protein LBV06_09235 [Propionibacteriaceae bacterium]|nr:hypothetical protein [Propionibacteriaceae bacterium]